MLWGESMEEIVNKITKFIREKVEEANANGVVVGLSGGIDSSVTAYLCVKALGKDKVLGLIMPEKNTNPKDVEHAKMVAENLGIKYIISDITDILKAFGAGGYVPTREFDKIADGNLKARIRMCILYYFANKYNLLVAGTSNKSEIYVGYGTKHGDIACDIRPIGNLFKTEVKKLAKYIGVPKEIIEKPPSAGLWEGQTDEEELDIKYETLDTILKLYEKGKTPEEIHKETNIPLETINYVFDLIKKNEHKRTLPPTPEI
ncbi:NH(3)-dependent NAD+ synthetase (nadE) [Methanocaldococcus jannaschii DSM 2661]|uniref:NH(3)-dependent NAD(+) synthetase n=2 Tax=Methanocaldococcus jannaschii TaxID=2190 RepID=NADE_METJA|nr:RecName: Full=NH(3)-dependent NAD(+) synthetase [Methanocaldococcus jannaschii DSM 2661]AAB99363.1 NH(3)-dependent NAD+ synthetase (nadE) [Methanocaldococcus jannaschii DSM 2661]